MIDSFKLKSKWVQNGKEAVEELKKNNFYHLILMDIQVFLI